MSESESGEEFDVEEILDDKIEGYYLKPSFIHLFHYCRWGENVSDKMERIFNG